MPPKGRARRPRNAKIPDAAKRIADGRAALADREPEPDPRHLVDRQLAESMAIQHTLAREAEEAEAGHLAELALERAANAPVPRAFRHEWWPAMVRTPEGDTIRVAKVYATASGLYVYAKVPAQADRATGGVPTWYAPINYSETPRPATGYAARKKGVRVVTEAGIVTVTPLGGCGCAFGQLKAWRPNWAQRNEAWEAPA